VDRRHSFPPDFRLFLASQSPRRHSLLGDIGVPFTVVPSNAEEALTGHPASVLAEKNALAKVDGACLPADAGPGAFVLGTDTLVTIDGTVMGKPHCAGEAAAMLAALSGRTHEVVSGVALARLPGGRFPAGERELRAASAVTEVSFLPLDPALIEAYLAAGEWKGKAGGYAVQGLAGLYVSGICGEYSNVVGLPLCLLGRMFRRLGFDLVRREWLSTGPGKEIGTPASQ
jgi:septum formation protein